MKTILFMFIINVYFNLINVSIHLFLPGLWIIRFNPLLYIIPGNIHVSFYLSVVQKIKVKKGVVPDDIVTK